MNKDPPPPPQKKGTRVQRSHHVGVYDVEGTFWAPHDKGILLSVGL